MAKKEKFGKFILFDQLDVSGLGSERRAAKLSATGLEKIVSVIRLSPSVSGNAEAAKAVMDQAKIAAQLQNPNILRIYGIGKVDAAYYLSTEYVEGKHLGQVFERCRRDAFPFSVDHALLIASKVCSALEYSHTRKIDPATRYFHGLVSPRNILVSYEGEVRVRGFGYWLAKLRDTGALQADDLRYLAPEQVSGGMGDTRSDIYSVGAVLFEALTGQPFVEGGVPPGDTSARISAAKLQAPTGDDDKIPKPIAEILTKALATDPQSRYAEVQAMRKGIDTLLFSGDFTPTTFNLAFFMHSVFRDDIDRESKELKEEKEANYAEFVGPVLTPVPATAANPSPAVTPIPAVAAKADAPLLVPIPAHIRESVHTPVPVPAPAEPPPQAAPARPPLFAQPPKEPSRRVSRILLGVLLLALVGGGYWYFTQGPAAPKALTPTTTTLSEEAVAARAQVRELEAKLKALQDERAAAEQKAQEEAAAKLQKEAKARGAEVDAAALQKAKEEAAQKARAEQEKKQQEEKKKLEQEKAEEEARLAEEQKKAEEAARVAAATSTTVTLAPATTQPSIRPGALVSLGDNGVIAPVLDRDKAGALVYPPLALRYRIEGTVEISLLVDENGNVTDTKIIKDAGGKWGLNEAAIDHVRKWHYKPANKDGVPVKVWVPVRIPFKLP